MSDNPLQDAPPARRDSRLIPLSHDHHTGLARARDIALALDGTVPRDFSELAAECLRFAEADLMPHFEREERLLVPPFISHVGEEDADLITMQRQHAELRALTDALVEPQGNGPDVSLSERLDAWSKALNAHIRFEERTLFGRIQNILSEAEMAIVGAGLSESSGPV